MKLKKLEIDDICEVYNIEQSKAQFMYIDHQNINQNNNGRVIPPLVTQTVDIDINKPYINDKLILKEVIDLLKEKNDTSFINREDVYNFDLYDVDELKDNLKIRRLSSKINSNASLIAVISRIGPGNNIIFPKMFKEFDLLEDYFSTYNCFYSDYLTKEIIIFRKELEKDNNDTKIVYIKNKDDYNIVFISNYETHYSIVNIISKKRDRLEKLERILEE